MTMIWSPIRTSSEFAIPAWRGGPFGWFDWTLLDRHRDLHRFVKTLVGQRLMLGKELGIEGVSLNELLQQADIRAHGIRLNEPDLGAGSHSLAFTVRNKRRAVMFRAADLRAAGPGTGSRRVLAPMDRHLPRCAG